MEKLVIERRTSRRNKQTNKRTYAYQHRNVPKDRKGC